MSTHNDFLMLHDGRSVGKAKTSGVQVEAIIKKYK